MDSDDREIELARQAPSLLANIEQRLHQLSGPDGEATAQSLHNYLDAFQECPQLLDPLIPSIVHLLSLHMSQDLHNSSYTAWTYRLLYVVCKVRSYKVVCRFLPSDVDYLELVVARLERSTGDWYHRYGLFVWLGILVLIPFQLELIGPATARRVYNTCLSHCDSAAPERSAAAVVLARLLARADTQVILLPEYLGRHANQTFAQPNLFARISVLQTASHILQKKTVPELALHHLQDLVSLPSDSSMLLRKHRAKCIGQLCLQSLYSPVLEDLVGQLLEAVGDPSTEVRHSASKALARVCARLDPALRRDVVAAIEAILDEDVATKPDGSVSVANVSSDKWQGALLTLAQLAQRRLLDLDDQLLQHLKQALRFEQKMLTHAVGAPVRDAACYVCWALFRASQALGLDHVQQLVHELACMCCFDRELGVRRAASAAIQEAVGRQLSRDPSLVASSLQLIQAVDFYKINLLPQAFLTAAPQVQALGHDLWPFIVTGPLVSWDPFVRRLAAETLALVVTPAVMPAVMSKLAAEVAEGSDRDTRHGLCYAIANLATADHIDVVLSCLHQFSKLELARANEPVNADAFLHLYTRALRCYDKVSASHQSQLAALVPAFCQTLNASDPVVEANVLQVMRAFPLSLARTLPIHEWLAQRRRGLHIRALSGLQWPELVEEIVSGLVQMARARSGTAPVDPGLRADAIGSLASFLEQGANADCAVFVSALDDYSVDHRGDVGSWSREASLRFLARRTEAPYSPLRRAALPKILRIALEPMEKLRALAVTCLVQSYAEDADFAFVAQFARSLETLSIQQYFHRFLELTTIDSRLQPFIIKGLVCSMGAQQSSEDTLTGSVDGFAQFAAETAMPPLIEAIIALLDPKHGPRVSRSALQALATVGCKGLLAHQELDLALVLPALGRVRNPRLLIACIDIVSELLSTTRYRPLLDYLVKQCSHPDVRVRTHALDQVYFFALEWAPEAHVMAQLLDSESSLASPDLGELYVVTRCIQ